MLPAMLFALVVIIGLLVVILIRLSDIMEYQQGTYQTLQDLKRLSLNPRTRLGSQLQVQSGATSQEQTLARLGRASAARRVVVGGDSTSGLHEQLSQGVEEEKDD